MPPARKNRSAAPAVVCMAHKRREKTKAHAKHVENIGQFLQDRGSTPRASTNPKNNSESPPSGYSEFFLCLSYLQNSTLRLHSPEPETGLPGPETPPESPGNGPFPGQSLLRVLMWVLILFHLNINELCRNASLCGCSTGETTFSAIHHCVYEIKRRVREPETLLETSFGFISKECLFRR